MNKDLLDVYSDYLISQSGYATATGLSLLLDGAVSHDQVSRFLREDDYGSKELWKYVKPFIRKHEEATGGVLLLDDTISEKTYTDENEVNCWHFPHAKNRHVKGLNLLSCVVRYGDIALPSYGDIALPISYEVVKKDRVYSDIATKRQKRKASISKNTLFRQLIQQAVSNDVTFDYVLADSWFGSKQNMMFIYEALRKTYVFGIKSNRCIAMTENDAKRGQFQQVKSLDWKDGDYATVYLKDIVFPVTLLKKAFTNKGRTTGTLYLVTNDLSIDSDRLYEVYQKRWRIEEFHKSIKQNASLSKSPTKTPRTQCNHLFASLVAFCKLEILKMKTTWNHFAIKYKLLMKANQIMFWELQKMKEAAA